MPAVALDTNALMMPVELGVRVFDELDRLFGSVDPVTPAAVLAELDALATGGGQAATAASVGADLARDRCEIVETAADFADDAVLELARIGRAAYIVTNDKPLRDRALAAGVPVVGVRGHNTLHVIEP